MLIYVLMLHSKPYFVEGKMIAHTSYDEIEKCLMIAIKNIGPLGFEIGIFQQRN